MFGIEILDRPVGSQRKNRSLRKLIQIWHASDIYFKHASSPDESNRSTPFVATEEYKNAVFLQNASSSLLPSSLL